MRSSTEGLAASNKVSTPESQGDAVSTAHSHNGVSAQVLLFILYQFVIPIKTELLDVR